MNLLTSFAGRIGRGKFWLGFGLMLVMTIILGVILGLLGNAVGISEKTTGNFTGGQIGFFIVSALGYLALIWANFALMVKRCHDRGKSGWWSLIAIIPLAGAVWMIVDLGIIEGVPETNQWGPPAVPRA